MNSVKFYNNKTNGGRFDVEAIRVNGVWVEDELNKSIRKAIASIRN